MSVIDQNLSWGDCDLTPDLVNREAKSQPWHTRQEYARVVPEGAADSVYDVSGAIIPLRGLIIRVMFLHRTLDKPWKAWFDGRGWLVVTETGWRFYPQDHR